MESWDSEGTPDFQHYKGVEGRARSPRIRLERGTRRSSLNLHPKQTTKWLVHIREHPWVLGQTTGTLDHKTHHGPDSGEATTFPHIVFSATLRNLGKLQRRWAWPPGRPLDLITRIGLRTIRIALSLPLRLNGLTAASLGRARLPFRGACSPPCTFSIFLMIDGAVASLPVRGSPYNAPLRLHPNGSFSRDSQVGVPKLSRNCPGWSPGTLGAHNSRPRSLIGTRSQPNL